MRIRGGFHNIIVYMEELFMLNFYSPSSAQNLQRWSILFCVTLVLATGLGLSIFSLLGVCTNACAESHRYTLFGMPLAISGVLFFSLASVMWLYTIRHPEAFTYLALLFSVALGAEGFFLYIQHAWIGKWCPICLSIFMCVAFIWLFFTLSLLNRPATSSNPLIRRLTMNSYRSLFTSSGAILLGFLIVLMGISSPQLLNAQQIGKDPLYFGNRNSTLEMYVFTDWFCPACRLAEPNIERQAPDVARKAKLFFIDVPLHESSMNYVPYNLSFMLKEKTKYLKLRHQLNKLSEQKTAPTEKEVEDIATSLQTQYQQLDYAQVNQAIQYFKEIAKRYGVDNTPTVVLVNPKTQKMKKIVGATNIRSADFNKLLDELSNTK